MALSYRQAVDEQTKKKESSSWLLKSLDIQRPDITTQYYFLSASTISYLIYSKYIMEKQ